MALYSKYNIVFSLLFLLLSCKNESDKNHKILRYNQGDESLTSLDPAFARSKANIRAVTQLFNGLVELDEKLHVKAAIADSWKVTGDGTIYTFTLKKGIFFHNDGCFDQNKGREITAEDFVFTFHRIIDSTTASPGAWIFNDKVLRTKEGKISDTCFKATSKYELKIYLEKAFPAFLEILAMPYAFVVPKEGIVKYGKDFRVHPVGTGAFTFKHWDEGSTLIFIKNENFWRRDSLGNRLPYLDAVQVSFINDKTLAFLTFSQGKLDFLVGIEDNSPELFLEQDGTVIEEF